MTLAETQKTAWVERRILPILTDSAFGPESVKEILTKIENKNKDANWQISVNVLPKLVTASWKKQKKDEGIHNIDDILSCRINILKRHTRESQQTSSS